MKVNVMSVLVFGALAVAASSVAMAQGTPAVVPAAAPVDPAATPPPTATASGSPTTGKSASKMRLGVTLMPMPLGSLGGGGDLGRQRHRVRRDAGVRLPRVAQRVRRRRAELHVQRQGQGRRRATRRASSTSCCASATGCPSTKSSGSTGTRRRATRSSRRPRAPAPRGWWSGCTRGRCSTSRRTCSSTARSDTSSAFRRSPTSTRSRTSCRSGSASASASSGMRRGCTPSPILGEGVLASACAAAIDRQARPAPLPQARPGRRRAADRGRHAAVRVPHDRDRAPPAPPAAAAGHRGIRGAGRGRGAHRARRQAGQAVAVGVRPGLRGEDRRADGHRPPRRRR